MGTFGTGVLTHFTSTYGERPPCQIRAGWHDRTGPSYPNSRQWLGASFEGASRSLVADLPGYPTGCCYAGRRVTGHGSAGRVPISWLRAIVIAIGLERHPRQLCGPKRRGPPGPVI